MKSYNLSVDRHSLVSAIEKINNGEAGPLLDLEWLLLRFDDTVKYSGQLKLQSIEKLEESLDEFRDEFPGVLPVVEYEMKID